MTCEDKEHNWLNGACTECKRPTPKWKEMNRLCPCSRDGSRDHRSYCEEGHGSMLEGYENDLPYIVRASLPKEARCKSCHEYVSECNGTCAIPGPFIFKHGTVEFLLDGPTPTQERAWLNHFARACMAESIDIETIAHNFCQLGIGDPSQPEAGMADFWFGSCEKNGRAYNYAIWFVLRHTRGLEAMRKAIEEDMKKGDAEYGEIFLKTYGKDLLDNFLVEEPKWT